MNILLSINKKFFGINPNELISNIMKYDTKNNIKGLEVNVNNIEEQEYLKELAKVATRNNYIINLHAPNCEQIDEYKKYLDFSLEIAKINKRKINIVLHPITCDNDNESIMVTGKIVSELLNYIKSNKYNNFLELSLENLNDLDGYHRLKKEQLIDILKQNNDLQFTYDIGHELADDKYESNILPVFKEKINNIHIHSNKNNIDHYPLVDIFSEEMSITINLLNELLVENGDVTIVMEYALDYIDGVNFDEKFHNFVGFSNVISDRVTINKD